MIRRQPLRTGATFLVALSALWAGGAVAHSGSGPRETVEQHFTAHRPGSPTGVRFSATYHARGDQKGRPPFMRRLVVHPPHGMRFRTGVPKRCTASDAELQLMGPEACPPGSQVGRGSVEGLFLFPGSDRVFHHFRHRTYVLNNRDEQILLVESEGFTVVRGRIRRDGTTVFEPPTCFPKAEGVDCADDYIVQLETTTVVKPYTRRAGGRLRSYITTPPRCPPRGYWLSTARFWWSDGSVDRVPTRQTCVPGAARRSR